MTRSAPLSLLLLLTAAAAHADSASTRARTITRLADGVYMIRHPDAPDEFPQGNTTVVIGKREVLVVDSTYLPSEAKKDIAQIRQWTSLPVRYLVNTHWHFDHTMGNGAYAAAFPGLAIVAQRATAEAIAGYNPGWFERYPKRGADLAAQADAGKDNAGNPLDADTVAAYRKAAQGTARVAPEFKAIVDAAPNTSFDRELRVDLGGREVVLLHLGRGNTAGDAIAWLPKEKILVAGDLLDSPVPYLGGGYPAELVATLRAMGGLDFTAVVPGHGDVLRGEAARAHLGNVIEFVDTVVRLVSREIYRVGNGQRHHDTVRDAVLKQLDVAAWRKKFGGDDDKDNAAMFDGFSLPGVITAAFHDMCKR
jgi:glyoxylase-like metal-dependent hydrolase (beta-lactamase superfamily II)